MKATAIKINVDQITVENLSSKTIAPIGIMKKFIGKFFFFMFFCILWYQKKKKNNKSKENF